MVTTEPGVVVQGLARRFGATQALNDVDLVIRPGVLGVLGPNGAGKTTLMRTLATVLPVDVGRVKVMGLDVTDERQVVEVRRSLGYLPQVFGFYGGFTAAEFVEYVAWLKGMSPRDTDEAVSWALDHVGMDDRAQVKMRKLSGGMRRRVGIAQAIINRPSLLLLDEPTAGLDPEQRVVFRRLLRSLGESAAVVVSTHLVEDVAAACSRVAVMDKGAIRFEGDPADLIALGVDAPVEADTPVERGYLAALHHGAR